MERFRNTVFLFHLVFLNDASAWSKVHRARVHAHIIDVTFIMLLLLLSFIGNADSWSKVETRVHLHTYC
jgi:hypothetical protein